MQYIIIDNNDSFTYNLVHLVRKAEKNITVDVVNNQLNDLSILQSYDGIILSPGPGLPHEAGRTLEIINTYKENKKILGVCLGEQSIGVHFGAKLIHLKDILHGVQSNIILTPSSHHNSCDELFKGISTEDLKVGRYHSWAVDKENLPDCLTVTAMSDDGVIMALKHIQYNIRGVQFHPESILTPMGVQMMRNWINI